MDRIRKYLKDGVARFSHAQIPDYKTFGVEIIKTSKPIMVELGKNADKVKEPVWQDVPWSGVIKKREYFYWYSKPLHNYYHTLLDSLGCLWHYFHLKYDYPNLKLLVNRNHANLNTWPPYVKELLEILNIDWEYTEYSSVYETLFFGATLNQNNDGVRIQPKDGQFMILLQLINNALDKNLDVPRFDNIYISRRTQHNPIYSKDIIGEDNTKKRGNVDEDKVVDILEDLNFHEVFGENYTLAEKITMFHHMKKYVTQSGAGITNTFYRKKGVIGGIGSPGLEFPDKSKHGRHQIYNRYYKNKVSIYKDTSFVDSKSIGYNNPWKINSIDNFRKWARDL